MIPRLTLLASHEGQYRLVDYLIRLVRHTFVFSVFRRKRLEDGAVFIRLHPHRHRNLLLVVHRCHHLLIFYLGYKLGLYRRGHFGTHLIIYIGISIEMTSGEGEFLGRLHIEHLAVCRIHHLHFLPQVMIEVIVGLVAPFLLSAAEHVDVITTLIAGLHDGCGTLLLCLSFRLYKAYSSVSHLLLLLREFLAGRLLRAYLRR